MSNIGQQETQTWKQETLETPKCLWWGYKHTSGTYQVKRYFTPLDIEEAIESPFCAEVVGPFDATDRDDALEKVKLLTS